MKFVAGTSAPQGAKHRTVANRRARVHAINTVSVYLRGKRSSLVSTYQHSKCLYSIGKYTEWEQQSPKDNLHLRGKRSSEVLSVSVLVFIRSTEME